MRSLRLIASLAFAGLLIPVFLQPVQGQATPPAAPQASAVPAQDSAPAAASSVFHANANLVLVDVVVTDHGKPVRNLDKIHFHVFEDGREQPIASFDEHQPAAGPVSAAPRASLPPHTYTNAPDYPANSAVNVLLLDALNTPLGGQMEVRRQMLQYLTKIPPGTSMAIFTLASRLRLAVGFTTDVARLTQALQDEKNGAKPSEIPNVGSKGATASAADQVQDVSVSPYFEKAKEAMVASLRQFAADDRSFQTDQRVQITMNALQQLARYLSAVPGRKNLIGSPAPFPFRSNPTNLLKIPSRPGAIILKSSARPQNCCRQRAWPSIQWTRGAR